MVSSDSWCRFSSLTRLLEARLSRARKRESEKAANLNKPKARRASLLLKGSFACCDKPAAFWFGATFEASFLLSVLHDFKESGLILTEGRGVVKVNFSM